ncbi:MAG: hypothetical protein C5B51_26645 [Terriglobia bacterium]|nr:MAG: hypothetical protein C5B51_26645 [Terriglobia bacterium]
MTTGTLSGAFRLAPAILLGLSAHAATFGRTVPLIGGSADIVLDESRGRIYLTSPLQSLVQIYSIQQQRFLTPIQTDATPLAAALSRDRKFLYVACYDSSALDVIDLDGPGVVARAGLPSRPEGVAVGGDGRVLISTSGNGTNGTANVLLLYDPSPNASQVLASIPVAPPASTPPTLPPPSGRPFLATHSQLVATRDGATIVGINAISAAAVAVFVYETSSNTVLRSRSVAGTSAALSVSDDGTRFMAGPNLFDAVTLQVLAQANMANAPYPITTATNFNLQSNQGGGVFSPDGQALYAAFDISPIQNPPAPANVSQLMLADPDNLLVRLGVELPENLAGKMVISADGANIYALSDSGFMIIPAGTITRSPVALPASNTILLTKDQCGVTSQTSSAALTVNNPSGSRVTASAQLLQIAGQPNQSAPATAPAVRLVQGASPQVMFSYNAAAARGLGTISPPHDFLVQAPEAINLPNRVRVYENSRDAEARGTILPLPIGGATGEAFPDLLFDQPRQRLYIANVGLNRIEVYDIRQRSFLAPIKVGQMPISMALTADGNTLYVANSGGETISVVDPEQMQTVGRISFPPIPFNSNAALASPRAIAAGLSGPQVLMSNGTLWRVVGNTASPRPPSRIFGQNNAGVPNPIPTPNAAAMTATPGGEYILLATATGMGYLYDASADDWVAGRQVGAANAAGYIGPVAAGPRGQYYSMNGTVLNQALVPVGGGAAGRLVSAVAPMGNNNVAIFSPPPVAAANAQPTTPPVILVMDATTGAPMLQANALEGPITQVTGAARATISGRTMAIDAAAATAYVITTSGLSIIPLSPVAAADRPQPAQKGAVNLASYQLPVASNGLLAIFGQNLASSESASSAPLPLALGGTCVTLNNVALPLFATSPTQINAQIPPELAAGTYPLIVRSIARNTAAPPQQLTVSKYAPAILVDANGQAALFDEEGRPVNKDNPTTRDRRLTLYAVGLGPTTGGTVTGGAPSPSNPLAVTGPVQVFFGNPSYKQAAIVVEWSGLAPGYAGLYQINLYVPGDHMKGDALPITLRVGNVSSPATGPVVPVVAVE